MGNIVKLIISFICGLLTYEIGIAHNINVDFEEQKSLLEESSQLCSKLNSTPVSFDAHSVTCENYATITFPKKVQ